MCDSTGTSLWWRSYVSLKSTSCSAWYAHTAEVHPTAAMLSDGGLKLGISTTQAERLWACWAGLEKAAQSRQQCTQGRNRRCITVDMRSEKGRDIIKRLSTEMDILVENFRPGVMEKWGLGPQASPYSPSLHWLQPQEGFLQLHSSSQASSAYVSKKCRIISPLQSLYTNLNTATHTCHCLQDLPASLVYTRISGYGQTGPKATLPG